jgi:hypothetical protein
VKVVLGRPKDLDLLRALLKLGLLDLEKLRAHYHAVPLREPEAFIASRNLHALTVL